MEGENWKKGEGGGGNGHVKKTEKAKEITQKERGKMKYVWMCKRMCVFGCIYVRACVCTRVCV